MRACASLCVNSKPGQGKGEGEIIAGQSYLMLLWFDMCEIARLPKPTIVANGGTSPGDNRPQQTTARGY